jgi:hypothetical protein
MLVYAPLSVRRAPGGANFWAPTSGKAFGYQSFSAAREGRALAAWTALRDRARANWREVTAVDLTEGSYLLMFAAMPVYAVGRWRHLTPRARRFFAALALGWAALVAALAGVYVLGRWSGFRYLMVLMPAFLPAFASPGPGTRLGVVRWWPAAALFVAGFALLVSTHRILDPFKATSAGAPQLLAYIERYFGKTSPRTVLFFRGYHMALADPPIEAVVTLPADLPQLRQLEDTVWFDYVILSSRPELRWIVHGRKRYQLVNGDDPEPPVRIYRRSAAPR